MKKRNIKVNIIYSKNLILRPIKISDLQDYWDCLSSDPKLKEFLLNIPKNKEEAKKRLKKSIDEFKRKKPYSETFAIEVNNEFVGYVEISHLNVKQNEHKAEVGYCINLRFRERGYATKAVKLLTNYAFSKYEKLRRISAVGRLKNKGSARVLEKAGYNKEGVLRKNKCINKKFFDDFIYAKVK